MLPRFLIGDNCQETPEVFFIMHTIQPRCIIELDGDQEFEGEIKIHWIDEQPSQDEVDDLVNEAQDFFDAEIECNEEYEEEEDDEEGK
jgi:hypothetical protein